MLVDMPLIVGSRYPVSHCFQSAAGAAKGHKIGHVFACQKVYIIFIYGVKQGYDRTSLLLVTI